VQGEAEGESGCERDGGGDPLPLAQGEGEAVRLPLREPLPPEAVAEALPEGEPQNELDGEGEGDTVRLSVGEAVVLPLLAPPPRTRGLGVADSDPVALREAPAEAEGRP
jgi:hypothetical protein